MTGGNLVKLILVSMGWLFFLGFAWMNGYSWYRGVTAREGERVPSGVILFGGLWGGLMAYASVRLLERADYEVPWPWFWIGLPLFLDVYCLGWVLLYPFKR